MKTPKFVFFGIPAEIRKRNLSHTSRKHYFWGHLSRLVDLT